MPNERSGSIHLGRVAGIDLFLHWSWFVAAAIEIEYRRSRYTSLGWSVLEYLALFLIVLLHEFGHALACRQVGGVANRIMLWPLGGVAYVNPPQRPGAILWSLAAGPLVNVVLLLPLTAAYLAVRSAGWAQTNPGQLVYWILWINVVLLLFNLLPIYPLDGGQILRALLWYVMGRGRSLAVATILGFVFSAGLVVLAVWMLRSEWTLLIAGYLLLNCWSGMKNALHIMRMEKQPRRDGFACPGCGLRPALGANWKCGRCNTVFDTFATGSVCPSCGAQYPTTMCGECQTSWPFEAWATAPGKTIEGSASVTR